VLAVGTSVIAVAGVVPGLGPSALLGGAGALLLYVAARVDLAAPGMVLPAQALRPLHPVGAGLLMVLALAAGSVPFTCYGPVLLEVLFGTSPLVAGYILAAESIAWTVGTLTTSGLSSRAEPSLIRGGAAMIAAGGVGLVTGPAILRGCGR